MILQVIGLGVIVYGLIYSVSLYFLDCDLELALYKKFGKSIRHLKGKVVFITGASSGIGEHTAIAFAKHGVKLVLAARRTDELERVKKICIDVSEGQLKDDDVLVLQMDMKDIPSHEEYFGAALKHFGQVDVLFNNAGRSQRAMWEETDLRVDKEMFDLNVFSIVNLSRIAVNYFGTKGVGHIAINTSIAGVIGVPFSGTYAGTKHALHGYFNGLRTEKMDKNIYVTLLCPGPTFTNFLQESFTGTHDKKYGVTTQPTDKRMTAERCGELCAISIANRLNESWIAILPIVPLTYIAVYFPLLYRCGLRLLGPQRLFKLRDSSDTTVLSEVRKAN